MFSHWSEKQQQACKILGYKKWLPKNYKTSKPSQEKIIKIQLASFEIQNTSTQNISSGVKQSNNITQTHQPITHSVTSDKAQDCVQAQSIKGGAIFSCQKFTLLYNSTNHTLWVLPPLFLAGNQWQVFLSEEIASLWLKLLEYTNNQEDYNFFETVSACNEILTPVSCSDDNIQQIIDAWDFSRINVLAGEYFSQQVQHLCSETIPCTLFISPCLLSCNNQLKYQLWLELEKYSTINLNK